MTTKDELVPFDNWIATLTQNGRTIYNGPLWELDNVEAQLEASVEGDVTANLFVYLLQVGEDKKVAVLAHPAAASPADSHVRIPVSGTLETLLRGSLIAVGCAHLVSDDEWPDLVGGGHDGAVKTGSGAGGVVKSSSTTSKPKEKPVTQ